MLSRYSVMIMILGSSVFLETVFLLLFREQIPQSAISLAMILGIVTMTYIMVGISFTAVKNKKIDSINVDRKLATRRLFARDLNYIEVTVTNPTIARLDAVRVIDNYPESFTLVEGSNTCSVTLPPYSEVTFSYILRANERGSYRIGPTEAYVSDQCGYAIDLRKFDNEAKVVVYPPIARHTRKKLKKPSEHQSTGTKYSKKKGRGFDYVGSRKYIVGDEIKLVDWKFLAKTNEPGTKEFQVERNIDIMLVIDCSGSMNMSTGRETKLDTCADGCAYLAYQFLKQGDSVGVMTCAPSGMEFISPKMGGDAHHRVLSAIASIEGEKGKADLAKYISHAVKNMSGRTIFFVFTDSCESQELVKVANIIRETKHDVIFVIPYIDIKHYGNTLFLSETRKHNRDFVSALAHVLFIEEITVISKVVEGLRRRGVQTLLVSTDEMKKELVSKMGVGS